MENRFKSLSLFELQTQFPNEEKCLERVWELCLANGVNSLQHDLNISQKQPSRRGRCGILIVFYNSSKEI